MSSCTFTCKIRCLEDVGKFVKPESGAAAGFLVSFSITAQDGYCFLGVRVCIPTAVSVSPEVSKEWAVHFQCSICLVLGHVFPLGKKSSNPVIKETKQIAVEFLPNSI